MAPCIWLRAYLSGHMALGIWLQACGSGHMAPGIWRQAYGSGRAQETVLVQLLVRHAFHVGGPKVPKPVCAQRFANREMH